MSGHTACGDQWWGQVLVSWLPPTAGWLAKKTTRLSVLPVPLPLVVRSAALALEPPILNVGDVSILPPVKTGTKDYGLCLKLQKDGRLNKIKYTRDYMFEQQRLGYFRERERKFKEIQPRFNEACYERWMVSKRERFESSFNREPLRNIFHFYSCGFPRAVDIK